MIHQQFSYVKTQISFSAHGTSRSSEIGETGGGRGGACVRACVSA